MTHYINVDSVSTYVLYEGSNKKLFFSFANKPKLNDLIIFKCSRLHNRCERKIIAITTVSICGMYYDCMVKLAPALDL